MHRHAIAAQRLGGYPLSFLIALAANALFFTSIQLTFPVLPGYIAGVVLGQPPDSVGSQVGMATTVLSFAAALSHIPSGYLVDRFGRRRFMFLGAACFTLSPLIYGFSRGMPLLLLGRAVHGVGLAMFAVSFQALVTDLSPAERRGEALGLAGMSLALSSIAGPPAGEWLAAALGFSPFFLISAGTAAASMLLVVLIPPPSPSSTGPVVLAVSGVDSGVPGPASGSGLRQALAQRGIRAAVLCMAAMAVPVGAFISFLPLVTAERGMAGSGIVFSLYAGALLLVQPAAGWLSDRVGRNQVILPGLAVIGLAAVALSFRGALPVFILAGIALGAGRGLCRGGVDALVQDSVPPTLRGTAAAVQYTSFDFWIGFSTFPLGLAARVTSYGTTFLIAGLAALAGGTALAVMLHKAPVPGTRAAH